MEIVEFIANFYDSAAAHQLKIRHGVSLMGTLTKTSNRSIKLPARGVLVMLEQTTLFQVNSAVFHALGADGRLGAPCLVKDVEFVVEGAYKGL